MMSKLHLQVQLQRPPKRNINWDELRRLKDSSEHVEIEIEAVNRYSTLTACKCFLLTVCKTVKTTLHLPLVKALNLGAMLADKLYPHIHRRL